MERSTIGGAVGRSRAGPRWRPRRDAPGAAPRRVRAGSVSGPPWPWDNAFRAGGEQPRVRCDGRVALVAVLTLVHGLVHVPRLRIDGGDDPFRAHAAGDAPPPVGAVASLGGFDVLPGDQRQ